MYTNLKKVTMNNNIFLSLKTTLRIALPCLALSLFAVSCSNDESVVFPESTTKGKTISFTAEASELTENYSTRVGLDIGKIPPSELAPEPIIWLLGDKFAVNFVKYGEATGQVIEFTATSVSKGGLAVTMTAEIDLENGLYQAYVVTPNTSGTFQGGAVSGTLIDLRGQSQPGATTNYSNLSDYYYQSAYTIFEIKDNEIVTGSTNFTFTALNSMLRYQITSELANDVTVKKIKIDHSTASTNLFYTRGYFDPATGSSVVPAGSPIPTLSVATDELLEPSSSFNAYMTLLPTEGFLGDDSKLLSVTVYFYQGAQLWKRAWTWPANLISNNLAFPARSRYMFDLTLRTSEISLADPNELNDLEEEELLGDGDTDNNFDPAYSTVFENYLYSVTAVNPDIIPTAVVDNIPYYPKSTILQACANGWSYPSASDGYELKTKPEFFAAISSFTFGYYGTTGLTGWDAIAFIYADRMAFTYRPSFDFFYDALVTEVSSGVSVKALCRRAI